MLINQFLRIRRHHLTLIAIAAQCIACGGSSTKNGPIKSSEPKTADFGVESYLPLIRDTVLSFETEREGSSERGLLVMQIRRPRADMAELHIGNKIHRLDLVKDGVRYAEGGYVLKLPLEVGATFSGQYGLVKVINVHQTVVVPAGHFDGCVETEESSGTSRTTTTYCPTIGITQLEVESLSADAPGREIVRLKSNGPLVDLGQDQLKVTQ